MTGKALYTTVRISNEVLDELKKTMQYGDTPDDVLRDILGMPDRKDRKAGRPRKSAQISGETMIHDA